MDSTKKKNYEKKNHQGQRKPYSPPKLICYGNVADLTQGTSRRTREGSRRR